MVGKEQIAIDRKLSLDEINSLIKRENYSRESLKGFITTGAKRVTNTLSLVGDKVTLVSSFFSLNI